MARLMHEHGIQAHRKRPFRKTTDSKHAFPPAPTLLIVGNADEPAIEPNRQTLTELNADRALKLVPGAGRLIEEPVTKRAGLAPDPGAARDGQGHSSAAKCFAE